MQCNVGKTDRMLRIFGGLGILAAGALMQNWWGLLGVVPLVTGVIRFCPAYLPFGIHTGKKT